MGKGRFAPSPSGRMHLGNVLCCLLAWLSAKQQGGTVLLRIEDLDAARCPRRHAEQLMDDLLWLGLPWDEGPVWNGFGGGNSAGDGSDADSLSADSSSAGGFNGNSFGAGGFNGNSFGAGDLARTVPARAISARTVPARTVPARAVPAVRTSRANGPRCTSPRWKSWTPWGWSIPASAPAPNSTPPAPPTGRTVSPSIPVPAAVSPGNRRWNGPGSGNRPYG